MIATHHQMTRLMRSRLKTTSMGLGLVRLLEDAKRFDEAKTVLYSLETGFPGVEADKPSQKPCKAYRLKGVTKTVPRSSALASTKLDAAEMLTIA